jgi:excisionase family DNA binding protein
MNQEKTQRITFDRKEAARKLGISVVTLDRELAKRKMPHFRVGRRVLFTQELLERYIEQNTQDTVIRRSRNLS